MRFSDRKQDLQPARICCEPGGKAYMLEEKEPLSKRRFTLTLKLSVY